MFWQLNTKFKYEGGTPQPFTLTPSALSCLLSSIPLHRSVLAVLCIWKLTLTASARM